MKSFFKILSACFLLSVKTNFLFAQTSAEPFAVIELFTSEGCSSCLPADKILSDIIVDAKKNDRNIFCLEYHVDYWNHGGWKDPFSKYQFTMRQNAYSSTLQQRELYTPQMIVNGEAEFTGSHADLADAAIHKALSAPAKISLSILENEVANDSLSVHFAASETGKNLSLHFAIVESNIVSKISKGENSGKTVKHDQVVRIFYSFELKEKKGMVKIPLKGWKSNAACKLIAFVQNKQTMKILAATEKTLFVFR